MAASNALSFARLFCGVRVAAGLADRTLLDFAAALESDFGDGMASGFAARAACCPAKGLSLLLFIPLGVAVLPATFPRVASLASMATRPARFLRATVGDVLAFSAEVAGVLDLLDVAFFMADLQRPLAARDPPDAGGASSHDGRTMCGWTYRKGKAHHETPHAARNGTAFSKTRLGV